MKVISYQRVSTQAQDLARQQFLAEEFCSAHGYDLVGVIKEKVSGAKEDRESINKLLALTNEDCDMVVVSELSRITREDEYYKILYYIETIKKNGISVHFLDNSTTYKADQKFSIVDLITLIVSAYSANEERKKINQRMSSGLMNILKDNPYMSLAGAPFGYDVIDNPDYKKGMKGVPVHLLVLNEVEVSYIHQAFNMVLEGKSSYEIARYFNNNNIKTKTGKKWTSQVILRNILKNKLYIGIREVRGITHKVDKIIDKEVFDRVGEMLSAKNCRKGSKNINILKGLIFCAKCGQSMYLTSSKGHNIYRCMTAQNIRLGKSVKKCNNTTAREDLIVKYVWECYKKFHKEEESVKLTATTLKSIRLQMKEVMLAVVDCCNEVEKIGKEMTQVKSRLVSEGDDYIYNILKQKLIELEEKNKEYVERTNKHRKALEELNHQSEVLKNEIKVTGLTDSEKQKVLRDTIDKILIGGKWGKFICEVRFKNGWVMSETLTYRTKK